MPATSRTWLSTRSMLADWLPLLRAGAPPGDRRLERLSLLQTIFRRGELRDVHIFFSQPIRRWPCLIRNDPAVAAAVEPAVAVAAAVAAAGAVVPVEVAPAAAVRVAPVEVAVREEAAKVGPAAAPVAGEEVVQVEAPVAVPVVALCPTITIRPITNRGQSCRHSHLRLRPTSKSWLRWRKERAVLRFSTPTTC